MEGGGFQGNPASACAALSNKLLTLVIESESELYVRVAFKHTQKDPLLTPLGGLVRYSYDTTTVPSHLRHPFDAGRLTTLFLSVSRTASPPTPIDCLLPPLCRPFPLYRLSSISLSRSRQSSPPAHHVASSRLVRRPGMQHLTVLKNNTHHFCAEVCLKSLAPTPSSRRGTARANTDVFSPPTIRSDKSSAK